MGPIARATIKTSFVFGLRLITQAGFLLLITRLLGPNKFGAFAGVASLAVVLGTFSTFGTHWILLGEISKSRPARLRVLSYALPTTLICGSTLLGIFVLSAWYLLNIGGLSLSGIIAIGVAELLLIPLLTLISSELIAIEQTARSQVVQTLPLVLRVVAVVVVYQLNVTNALDAFAHGYGVAMVIALLISTYWIPERWPHVSAWRLPSAKERKDSLSFAFLNLTAMGPAEADKTLASKLLPLASAGIYSACSRVIGAATLPVVALMLASLPRLFRGSEGPGQAPTSLQKWLIGCALVYGIALGIAFWICAPFLNYLFGNEFQGIEEVIRFMSLAVPAMTVRISAGSMLMARGFPWTRAIFEAVGIVTLCVGAFVLTIPWGLKGMTASIVCSEWVMAILGITLIIRSNRSPH